MQEYEQSKAVAAPANEVLEGEIEEDSAEDRNPLEESPGATLESIRRQIEEGSGKLPPPRLRAREKASAGVVRAALLGVYPAHPSERRRSAHVAACGSHIIVMPFL